VPFIFAIAVHYTSISTAHPKDKKRQWNVVCRKMVFTPWIVTVWCPYGTLYKEDSCSISTRSAFAHGQCQDVTASATLVEVSVFDTPSPKATAAGGGTVGSQWNKRWYFWQNLASKWNRGTRKL
jgi:hypothetical protein